MPLSTDEQILETSNGLVNVLRGAAGDAHHSFRPAHAKGHLLTGTFTPTTSAAALTSAPHFTLPSTPLTVRFSSSTGLPQIPDTDGNANPRGLALRFHLPPHNNRRVHTDIILHSTPYFPTRTGSDFLAFLSAATGPQAAELVPEFLARHPETARFLAAAKPSPVSFATEAYWGVNAFRFVKEGRVTVLRYRVVPGAGVAHFDEEGLKGKSADYLVEELAGRLEKGSIGFKLLGQIAGEGDVTDDATVIWPEEREIVELGTIRIEKMVSGDESLKEQRKIIFDPIPRVEGVEPSDDPLLEVRASVYLIAGRQRREAGEPPKAQDAVSTEAAKAAT